MNSNEYLLSKINELQNRLSMVENSVIVLQQSLKGSAPMPSYSQSLKTSIPLGPITPNTPLYADAGRRPMNQFNDMRRPMEQQEPPMAMSELLEDGEMVTFSIIKGKDESGALVYSILEAMYDNSTLTVKACSDAPELEGTTSSKPGEILYKFMFALKERGVISRTFQALPWRLCSVVRNGERVMLSQLRRNKQESTPQ